MSRLVIASALPLLLLAACSGASGNDEQPGTLTADESRQLNEAAEMLDANSVDLNAASSNDRDAS